LGVKRAVAARARVNLEVEPSERLAGVKARLGDVLARLGAHDETLAAHTEALSALPPMGRALEGLAARIDRLDGLTEGLWSAGPSAPTASPATATLETAVQQEPPGPSVRRRQGAKPQPTFVRNDGRLRILGVNDMFPLISETYIREELASLM